MFKAYRKKKRFFCRLLSSNSVYIICLQPSMLSLHYKKDLKKNFNVNNWSSLSNGYRNTLVFIKIQYIFCAKACSQKHNVLSMSISANFIFFMIHKKLLICNKQEAYRPWWSLEYHRRCHLCILRYILESLLHIALFDTCCCN